MFGRITNTKLVENLRYACTYTVTMTSRLLINSMVSVGNVRQILPLRVTRIRALQDGAHVLIKNK